MKMVSRYMCGLLLSFRGKGFRGASSSSLPRSRRPPKPYISTRLGFVVEEYELLLSQRKVLDLTVVDPDLRGFTGGFVAGHWGFLVPFKSKKGDGEFSGKMVRFDLRTFDYAGVTVRRMA